MSTQMRRNPLTREWVIYAPARSARPHDRQSSRQARAGREKRREDCPFCPGNEHMLPEILAERPAAGRPPWQTRVVPNKYPVLGPAGSERRSRRGIYLSASGYGRHEVIVESPRHDQGPEAMSRTALHALVETWHQRYLAAAADPRLVLAVVFRNHGEGAGTSLLHPHSQLVATAAVPAHVRRREQEAQSWFDTHGGCLLCAIAEEEGAGPRLLREDAHYATFVPYFSEVPHEVWIVPRRHAASFASASREERRQLAFCLGGALSRLHACLGDPDYNLVVNSTLRRPDAPELHWYVQVRPREVTPAGFEIGSGMRVNPSLPERDAEVLRS